MGYDNILYGESGNIIKAFRECAEQYGKNFTVEQYKKYSKNNSHAPLVHEIFAKSRFNKIKRFLFGEESLNNTKKTFEQMKKDYKEVCDRYNEPMNINEYGHRKDEEMVSPQLLRKKTKSERLMRWYQQKKKDELLGTNKAEKMDILRNYEFESFCRVCTENSNKCGHNSNTCPYWNEKILGE